MAGTLPLDTMSVEKKLQAMESLWDDLCNRAGSIASPSRHGDVLAERESNRVCGNDEFQDWEEAKRNIKNKAR